MPTTNNAFSTLINAIESRGATLATTAEAKDLVYLGKTVEAMNTAETVTQIIEEGDTQVAAVQAAGSSFAPLAGADFTGPVSLNEVLEKVTIDSTTSGTLNVDLNTQAVLYLDTAQTANRTLNFRGDGTNTLDSIMDVGQSLTSAVLATQGTTPYYFNTYQVDGNAVTPKWQGGTAPAAGNASGIDIYTITKIKTAANTFVCIASLVAFA